MIPIEAFVRGEDILKPVIGKHGFRALALVHGHQQSGDWASGCFVRSSLFRPTRKITVHIQQRIIRVDYEIGKTKVDHAALAKSLGATPRFPRPEGDALLDFEDLAADLHAFGGAFLNGSAKAFRETVARAATP